MEREVTHIFPINLDGARRDVVIAWNEVNQRTLSWAWLSHQRNGLSFRNGEIDVMQNLVPFVVGEMHMFQLYRVVECLNLLGLSHFLDVVFSTENLVDTLQRSQSLLDAVTRFGEVFDRLQGGVENHQIVDESTGINRTIAWENEITSKPQYNDNHARTQELAHRVCCRLTNSHSHGSITVFIVDLRKTLLHLLLSNECFDDAESSQSLFYLTDTITPFRLGKERTCFQLLADTTNTPCQQWHHQQREQRELPTHGKHGTYIDKNKDRILDQHVERGGDATIYLVHIGTHTCQDITFSFFWEERQRQRKNLLVDVSTDVAHNTCTEWHQTSGTSEICGSLQ